MLSKRPQGNCLHMSHTVRNLHLLSENSTLIFRENCQFLGVKNSRKCCGFGLFSCWQLWFHEENCQEKCGWKSRENGWVLVKIEFLDKNMTFRMVCPHDYCLFLIKDPPFLQIDIKAYQNMQSFAHLLAILLISAFFWPSQKCSFCGLTDRKKKNDLNSLREIVSKHSFCMHVSFICRDLVIVHIIFKRGCLKG